MKEQSLISSLLIKLNHYFFSKSRFHNLGLLRAFLVAIGTFIIYRNFKFFSNLTFVHEDFQIFHQPGFFIKLLHLPHPIPESYSTLYALIFYGIAFCAMVGFLTRPSLLIFGILAIYLNDIYASRGFFNHEFSLATQVLVALAFVPGSTNFSIDNIIKWIAGRSRKKQGSLTDALVGPSVSVWGVRLLLILLAVTYFTAGVSKIRYGTLKWLDGQTLSHYLDGSANPFTPGDKPIYIGPSNVNERDKWKDGFGIYSFSFGNRQEDPFWIGFGKKITSIPYLILLFSIATILFELMSLVVFKGRWICTIYLLGAILMHKSIGYLMGLPFLTYQVLCFFLIDWKWVYDHLDIKIKQKLDFLTLKLKRG